MSCDLKLEYLLRDRPYDPAVAPADYDMLCVKSGGAELYGEMEEASAELCYRCRSHRRNRELFADPIRQICYVTNVFLEGCADPKTISDQNRINAFESFYTEQLKHRATLLKRIAGENAEPFLDLNADYDLATVEKMEMEARRNRHKNQREEQKRKKAEKAAAKAAKSAAKGAGAAGQQEETEE